MKLTEFIHKKAIIPTLKAADKKGAIRDMLRELLAITTEWNHISEVWALALPSGERLVGYAGRGAPQRLFGNLPANAGGNRMLVGQAEQVFFRRYTTPSG